MKVYIVSYEFDRPNIASVDVVRETEKSYMIDKNSCINELNYTYYVSKRISKRDDPVFLSIEDAVEFILKLALSKKKAILNRLDAVNDVIEYAKEYGGKENKK